MHMAGQSFQQFMANLNSESCHSLIGFLTPEYLGFLKLLPDLRVRVRVYHPYP
jgi:hypothetical protein